jgi:hypothetical protein
VFVQSDFENIQIKIIKKEVIAFIAVVVENEQEDVVIIHS